MRYTRLILVGILVAGAILRAAYIGFGLPEVYEEATPMYQAWEMWAGSPGGVDLNPHFFNYPALTFYVHLTAQVLYYAGIRVIGRVDSVDAMRALFEQDPSAIVLLARWVTLLFGVAAVWATYRLGCRLSGPRIGLAAAACVAVLPTTVVESRFIQVDPVLLFLGTLALEAALRYLEEGGWRNAVWAGVWIGLAASAKYTGAMLAVGFVVSLAARGLRDRQGLDWRQLAAEAGLGGAAAIAAFVLTSPYCLLDAHGFATDFSYERVHMGAGHFGLQAGGAEAHYLTVVWHNLGPWLSPLLLLGLWSAWKDRGAWPRWAVPVVFCVAYTTVVSTWSMYAGRYLLPVWPCLALLVGEGWRRAADEVLKRMPKVRPHLPAVALLVLLCPAGLQSARAVARSSGQDPRTACKAWILDNVAPGRILAMERYTPDLPEDYTVIRIPMVAVAPHVTAPFYDPQWYADCNYLVTSAAIRLRYEADPKRFEGPCRFYRRLDSTWPRAAQFGDTDSPGPAVRVYRNPSPVGPDVPFDFSLSGRLDATTPEIGWKFLGGIATALNEAGARNRATQVCSVMAAVRPNEILTYQLLASLLVTQGRQLEAVEVCRRGALICPAGPARDAVEEKGRQVEAALLEDLARKRQALKTRPSDTGLRRDLVDAYTRLGRNDDALALALAGVRGGFAADTLGLAAFGILLERQDLGQAEALVADGLRRYPGNAVFHALRGALLEQSGDRDKAEAAYRTAAALPGPTTAAELGLGNMAYMDGDRADAERWWRKGIARDSTAAIVYLNTGFVLLKRGEGEEAESVWRKGLRASGGDPSLAYNLAQLYRSWGEQKRAFEVLIESLCRNPDDVDLYAAMGDLWTNQDSPQKADMYHQASASLAAAKLVLDGRGARPQDAAGRAGGG